MVKRSAILSVDRPPPSDRTNLLLAALPADDFKRIAPTLAVVPLKLKRILHTPGEPIQHVYFPGGGFCSMLTVFPDGDMVEIATVGREGMVGIAALLDGIPVTSVTMVQGESDTCYRMPADAFRQELGRRGAFYEVLTHWSHTLFALVAQSTACNAVHSIEQRLARWLLTAHDHMGGDDFPLTQEFVAMMLGATRQTVTLLAGTFQKSGLIRYRRGRVTILERRRLEAASCVCYRATKDLLRRTMAPTLASVPA